MNISRIVSICTVGLLICSLSGAALWEKNDGSHIRPRHCDPVAEPHWQEPGLLFVDPGYNKSRQASGLWVVPTDNLPRWNDFNRSLVTLDMNGQLKHRDETFTPQWERNIDDVRFFVDLVDVEQDEVPEIMVPMASFGPATRFDHEGKEITTYIPTPLFPYAARQKTGRGLPAIGDFTGDGAQELVFTGEWEWQAFRSDGEMIARYTVVDEQDQGQDTAMAHRENGVDYFYLVTGNIPITDANNPPEEPVPVTKRLHKMVLEPQDLPTPEIDLKEGVPGVDDPQLEYRFETVWMRGFPAASGDSELVFYDLTGDGVDEVILSHIPHVDEDAKSFSILDVEGNILYEHPWKAASRTAIGDVNGDGTDEVVAILAFNDYDDEDRYWKPGTWVSGVQWDGSRFQEIYNFQADDEFGGNTIVLCDVNGDGKDEILLHLGDPTVDIGTRGVYPGHGKTLLVAGNEAVMWEYHHFYGQPWRILIDDFTGDGSYEIIVGTLLGQFMVFSPAVEPSMDDYDRVFEAQLGFGWINEQEVEQMRIALGNLSSTTVDEPSVGESPNDASLPLFVLGLLAVLLFAGRTALRRRRG